MPTATTETKTPTLKDMTIREGSPSKADRKLREAILYISDKCSADPKYGATKLNKILFYADFESFRCRGVSVTGAEYIRLEHGPAPKRMKPLREQMIESGELTIKKLPVYNHTRDVPIALRRPDINGNFNAEDISVVDKVIEVVDQFGAGQLSKASHFGVPWQVIREGELIPYELIHVSSEAPSPRDIERTQELAREHGWEN
jgi:hypothetical protein